MTYKANSNKEMCIPVCAQQSLWRGIWNIIEKEEKRRGRKYLKKKYIQRGRAEEMLKESTKNAKTFLSLWLGYSSSVAHPKWKWHIFSLHTHTHTHRPALKLEMGASLQTAIQFSKETRPCQTPYILADHYSFQSPFRAITHKNPLKFIWLLLTVNFLINGPLHSTIYHSSLSKKHPFINRNQ